MREYIWFDSHKRYTWVEREAVANGQVVQCRLQHAPGAIRTYLQQCEPGTSVAVEATGNWYWIVGEIEQAGLKPLLVHPRKAKLMMGMINKTDRLDTHGMNRLQRNGTLPTVWIPRTRLVLGQQRTRLKNRISATVSKYGLPTGQASDPFGKKARAELEQRLTLLPPQAHWVTQQLLWQLDFVMAQMQQLEIRLRHLVRVTPAMQWLQSLPGVGEILAPTMALEIGEIGRFGSAEQLASYAGTTPRVHASGGKVRYGHWRSDVNQYLKWAFVEAANSVAVNHPRYEHRHASRLYRRLRERKGHSKAIGAVARHLAESAFYVLPGQQLYRDPARKAGCAREV